MVPAHGADATFRSVASKGPFPAVVWAERGMVIGLLHPDGAALPNHETS